MQDLIDGLRDRRKASVGQAPPTLAERRAAFAPAGRPHPVCDDVAVREVTAGGVRAHLDCRPGYPTPAGYRCSCTAEVSSSRRYAVTASWPPGWDGASGMRVLFPWNRLAPEHPFPAAIDDVLVAWRWLRTGQDLSASSIAVAGGSAGGGLAASLLVARRDAGESLPAAAVLMSPTVDLTGSGASMTDCGDQDPISTPGYAVPVRVRLPGRGGP
jgi:epsilon-lactone hydrolase